MERRLSLNHTDMKVSPEGKWMSPCEAGWSGVSAAELQT